MAKIVLDARFYGTEHTGLGRYTTNVLAHLPQLLAPHELYVLLRQKYYHSLVLPPHCTKVLFDVPHYSAREQFLLPLKLATLKADLLYTFHFNAPVLLRIPAVITIHDLIKTYFSAPTTTTRSPLIFKLKRAGYRYVMARTIIQAADIIVPTNTVKNQLLAHYPQTPPERLHPIPEAPDPIFKKPPKPELQPWSLDIPTNYLLFVGNAYPHKNLKFLLDAFKSLQDPGLHLVIVSQPNAFLARTLAPYEARLIHLFADLSDAQLQYLYAHAAALVTPSLMEGYGLVGLEALMVGTPVLASNIPVYREVYGDRVTYFDPHSKSALARAIQTVLKQKRPRPLAFERSWHDVAKSIAEVIHARCASL